ncbi:MAG: ribonuclease H-like domain-containing protein [Candidatus Acidiferrales bacterium]
MTAKAHEFLGRLKALAPARQGKSAEELRSCTPGVPEGSARLADLLGAAVGSNRFGEHLALRRWFSEPADFTPDPAALRLLSPGLHAAAADPAQWLFLDTETTGLAGGTGTYPFMVGIAWWDAGGLQVEQFFMRDHSEEHSVLEELAARLADRSVLVTFNGKSFDWPLLETRYRMTRSIRTPALRAHLDFLHPARHLWRLKIGSVRLAELERQVLGLRREGDVISSLIPQFYFDFLRGGSPDPLLPVFYHNQMDLRGLAALAGRILALLASPEAEGTHGLELFGVSRICERRGENAQARKLYEKSLAAELPPIADRAARRSLARLARRDGNFALAAQLWESIVNACGEGFESSHALEAFEQLAIHFERRTREPQRAAITVRRALVELRRAHRAGAIAPLAYRQSRARFEHRLARLEHRLERQGGKTLLGTIEAESPACPRESN